MNTPRPVPILVQPPIAVPEPCGTCGMRSISVCNAIDDIHLIRLAELANGVDVQAGRVFITEQDKATDFFNITEGTVRLFKLLPDGRRQITGFAGPGHFLGLAVSANYSFSAEAITDVKLCRFSRPRMRQMLHDFPALEETLLEVASNDLVCAQEQMLLLGRKTARERLASFLVARAHDGVPSDMPRTRLHLAMTREDIADYLGLTIETVSRTFSKLKADKLIAIPSPPEIILLNLNALQAVAAAEK